MPVKVSNVFDDGFEWIPSDEEYEEEENGPYMKSPISVEPVIFTFFISYSILGVIRAEYLVNRIAHDKGDIYEGSDDIFDIFQKDTCQINVTSKTDLRNEVQSLTAYWLLGLNVAEMLPALIAAPLITSWVKTFGVRPALIIPNIGYLASSIVWLAAVYNNVSLYYLIIAQVLQGMLGGFPAIMTLCNSFLAEDRANVDRSTRLVILGLMSELGSGLAQIGLGYWISNSSFLPPYWCVFGAMAFNILYILFCLEDSGSDDERNNKTPEVKSSRVGFLLHMDRPRLQRALLLLLLLLVHMMVFYASLNLVIIHAFTPPLCWRSIRSGYFVALTLFCGSIGTILGSRFFLLICEELGVVQIGICSFIGSLCLVAFGRSSLVVYVATLAGCFRFLISPALRNLLARVVNYDEQVVMFSLASLAETCGMLLGPTFFNLIYATTVAYSASVTFVTMAGVYVPLSLIIVYFQITMASKVDGQPSSGEASAVPDDSISLLRMNGNAASQPMIDGDEPDIHGAA